MTALVAILVYIQVFKCWCEISLNCVDSTDVRAEWEQLVSSGSPDKMDESLDPI